MLRWLRRLVFSCFRVFSSFLGFSRVFSSFLWFSRVFCGFSGFPELSRISCSFGDPSGFLWVPSESLCVLRNPFGFFWGSLGAPLGLLSRALGHFGIPRGSPWGPFGLPLGSLRSLWGHLGCPGLPKGAEQQKTHVFVCFVILRLISRVFVCFLQAPKSRQKTAKRKHMCFCVFLYFRVLSSTFEAKLASS